MSSTIFRRIGLILFAGMLHGCGPGRLPRKKMPEFAGIDGLEGRYAPNAPGDLLFALRDTSLLSGGTRFSFLVVSLPDPAGDSMAMDLVNSYKPFALPLLTDWAGQGKPGHREKGVLIDLREEAGDAERTDRAATAVHRAEYILERPGAFSISLILVWDPPAAGRAAWCLETLQSLSAFQCHLVTGSELPGKTGRQDCFASSAPCLDCP